jgi:hypothetical protein
MDKAIAAIAAIPVAGIIALTGAGAASAIVCGPGTVPAVAGNGAEFCVVNSTGGNAGSGGSVSIGSGASTVPGQAGGIVSGSGGGIPGYEPPAYTPPAPVYVPPAPVYVAPAPAYQAPAQNTYRAPAAGGGAIYVNPTTGGTVAQQADGSYVDSATGAVAEAPDDAAIAATAQAEADKVKAEVDAKAASEAEAAKVKADAEAKASPSPTATVAAAVEQAGVKKVSSESTFNPSGLIGGVLAAVLILGSAAVVWIKRMGGKPQAWIPWKRS